MEKFDQILILATVIAVLTQQFKTAVTDKRTRIASIIIGMVLAVVYKQGLLTAFGMVPAFSYGEYVDFALTGVLVAFGPNVIFAVNRKRELGGDTESFKTRGTV